MDGTARVPHGVVFDPLHGTITCKDDDTALPGQARMKQCVRGCLPNVLCPRLPGAYNSLASVGVSQYMLARVYANFLICDKGYISETHKEICRVSGSTLSPRSKAIPLREASHASWATQPKSDRLHDRHRIENAFCRMDKFKKSVCSHQPINQVLCCVEPPCGCYDDIGGNVSNKVENDDII